MSRPVSVAESTGTEASTTATRMITRGAVSQSSSRGNLRMLLTNLRLLDLDKLDDWPPITLQTFSAKENQKKRIQSVEWILYRLFEVWNPMETRDKLAPFFPPLEPLQSLNLRAALSRCLNELKKVGGLPKEFVLRKSMFDDCRGEKFEELLAVFSVVVVKKRVAAGHSNGTRQSNAQKLALQPRLSMEEQPMLQPLKLALEGSLASRLERRRRKGRLYSSYHQELLAQKAQLHKRKQSIREHHDNTPSPEADNAEAVVVKQQFADSWLGNATAWRDLILSGTDSKSTATRQSTNFDQIWAGLAAGQPDPHQATSRTTLQDLDSRVREQQNRVRVWKAYRDQLEDASKRTSAEPAEGNRTELSPALFHFDQHHGRQHEGLIPTSEKSDPLAVPKYEDLLANMCTRLSQVGQARRARQTRQTALPARVVQSLPVLKNSKARSLKTAVVRNPSPSVEQASACILERDRIQDGAPVLRETIREETTSVSPPPTVPSSELERASPTTPAKSMKVQPISHPAVVPQQLHAPSGTLTTPHQTPAKVDKHLPLASEADTEKEEDLAEQILNSVAAESPALVKQVKLSLTERTRMSIALARPVNEEEDDTPKALPANRDNSMWKSVLDPPELFDRRASLLERTRQSLSRFPPPNPRSRKSVHEKARTSLYPINQFETPQKTEERPEDKRDTTPRERLFSDDAEYGSVFKSRPKIAQSPLFSPQELPDEDVKDIGHLDFPDQDWSSSPLARGKRGAQAFF